VRVSFESREAFGEITKEITVRTNADNPVTVLKITAFIRTDLYIHKFVQFGKVQRGATLERTMEAKGEKQVGFRVTSVETDAPYLTATMKESPAQGEMGPKYDVRVVLGPGAPPGKLTKKLLLHTNLPDKPIIEVPIYAEVGGYLAFSAESLNFGTFVAGTPKKLSLEITAPADHPVKVTGVRSSTPDVAATLETVRPGHSYRVVCTVSTKKKPGRIFGTLVIETDDSAEPRREIALTGFAQ
jgi:hypothetical protein